MKKIGIFDSGIGGLSIVTKLRNINLDKPLLDEHYNLKVCGFRQATKLCRDNLDAKLYDLPSNIKEYN